ncbi:MAG: DUF4129 domain-containing protein [Myxococcota bacterium]
MTLVGLGGLFALYLLDEGLGDKAWIFLVLGASTFGGIGVGQVAALLRLRTWTLGLGCALLWGLGIALIEPLSGLGEDAAVALGMMFVLTPFFALAGLWSLRVHMGLLATWGPLVYLTGCIIVISEEFTGSSSQWFSGSKWAIWDLFSLPVLLLGTLFLIVFLVARERHRVQLWRFAKAGPDLPESSFEKTRSRSLGCGTLLALLALTLVLGGGAALTAPYLWRSADSEETGDPSGTMTEPSEPPPPPEPSSGCNQDPPEEPPTEPEPTETPTEQVVEAVKQAGFSLMTLILVLLMAAIGLLIFIPPMRRNMLLRHLRKPLWPVPPTRQVLLAWRVVEIALADIGVRRRPGDSAEALANRAIAELPPDIDHTALVRCAQLADRVLFGLGVDPTDPDEARRTAEMTYQAIWEVLGEGSRLRAVYRFV